MGKISAANPLFLDHLATTPLVPEVVEAMAPYLTAPNNAPLQGNKLHSIRTLDHARQQVAELIGAKPDEVIFTSGATEANNMALKGLQNQPRHILTTAIEHSAILEPLRQLEAEGSKVTLIPLEANGRVNLEAFKSQIAETKPDLVTVQATNNEIGSRQPVAEIGRICAKNGIIFHIDAAQGVIGQELDFKETGAHMMSLSAHKIYGPQGIGALIVRRDITLNPLLHGGGQQYALRPGTPPVALISGFGTAAAICSKHKKHDLNHLQTLKNAFLHILNTTEGLDFQLHSENNENTHPGLISLAFGTIPAESIFAQTPELVLATGAACNDALGKPSHVLKALGLRPDQIQATIRIGLGRYVTKAQTIEAANILVQGVERVMRNNVSP